MEKEVLENLLNETSSKFCMAKFHEATIWLYSGKIASCHHNPFHNVGENIVNFYNTATKRDQQKRMLAGETPDACNYCWKLEDQGLSSDRYFKSLNYPTHLPAAQYLDSSTEFKPQVLELAFSKTCNLGCSYCNADFSSQWVNDIRVNGTYNNIQTDTRKHFQRPIEQYKDAPVDMNLFWEWFETVVGSLDIIRITGGEPLLHEETFQLLEFARAKNPNVKIAINSNLCQKPVVIDRFIDKIKGLNHISIYTSNESAGATAELLREGMNYNEWLANIQKLNNAGLDHIFIMTTINAMCLESFDTFLLDIATLRDSMETPVTVSFNMLTYPEFQSLNVLPLQLIDYYYLRYLGFKQQHGNKLKPEELENYQRLLTRLQQPESTDQKELVKDWVSFFRQFGQRRDIDVTQRELYSLLEKLNYC